MLTIIPPKKPSIAVTSNNDVSSWDTDADIVYVNNTGKVYYNDKGTEQITNAYRSIEPPIYMLDEIGDITTDSSKAKSILYQEVKDGHVIIRQQPVSDTDREIANLWNILKEIDKDVQKRELMCQKINKELGRVDYYTWEVYSSGGGGGSLSR